MKYAVLLVGPLSFVAGCEQRPTPQQAPAPPVTPPAPASQAAVSQDTIRGDFDGDGTLEYVWLVAPEIDATDEHCVGECTSYLTSSNPALRPYALSNSIGGTLTKFSNLGPTRRDYLGILPDWFTSCWRDYYVLTYQQGAWQQAVRPFYTHCNQWENEVIPIEPYKGHPGHVLIRYTEFGNDSFPVRTKSVPLR